MKAEIAALMDENIIVEAATRWGAHGKIELLDEVANYVYQFQDVEYQPVSNPGENHGENAPPGQRLPANTPCPVTPGLAER